MKKIMLSFFLLFGTIALASAQVAPSSGAASVDFKSFKKMYFETPAMQTHLTNMKGGNVALYKEFVRDQDATIRIYKRYLESGDAAYLTELNARKAKYGLPITW